MFKSTLTVSKFKTTVLAFAVGLGGLASANAAIQSNYETLLPKHDVGSSVTRDQVKAELQVARNAGQIYLNAYQSYVKPATPSVLSRDQVRKDLQMSHAVTHSYVGVPSNL